MYLSNVFRWIHNNHLGGIDAFLKLIAKRALFYTLACHKYHLEVKVGNKAPSKNEKAFFMGVNPIFDVRGILLNKVCGILNVIKNKI